MTFTELFFRLDAYFKALRWGTLKTTATFAFLCAVFAFNTALVLRAPIAEFYNANAETLKAALAQVKFQNGAFALPENEVDIKDSNGTVYGIISKKPIDANRVKNIVFAVEGERLIFFQNGEENAFELSKMFPQEKSANTQQQAENGAKTFSLADFVPTKTEMERVYIPSLSAITAGFVVVWRIALLGAFAFLLDIPRRRLRLGKSLKLAMLATVPPSVFALCFSLAFGRLLIEPVVLILAAVIVYRVSKKADADKICLQ